jgi:hypothetical protein
MELFNNFNYGKKNLGWVESLTLMVKPKEEVARQILSQFVFHYSTKNGVKIVAFKHRWRWKFHSDVGGREV